MQPLICMEKLRGTTETSVRTSGLRSTDQNEIPNKKQAW
jgi:hypothetical protein